MDKNRWQRIMYDGSFDRFSQTMENPEGKRAFTGLKGVTQPLSLLPCQGAVSVRIKISRALL